MTRSPSPGTTLRPDLCGRIPFQPHGGVLANAAREGSHMLVSLSGQAPSTPGGPRCAPCAAIGGASRRIGAFTSEGARTSFQATNGGPGPSCWTLARSRRSSSSCTLHLSCRSPTRRRHPGAGTRVAPHGSTPPYGKLPIWSRPWETERRRDVQRFHPTGPPVGAPATRPEAKLRPCSSGPPPRNFGNS